MPAIFNFLKTRHKKGDASRQVPSASDMNKVATILQDIQGIGCRIEKPTDRGGKGWHIVVDGSTDIDPPDGSVVHSNKKATVVASALQESHSSGATGDYAGNFNVASIETDTDILERTVDGVLVKEGMSGIYYVTMQIHGKLENTATGTSSVEVTFTNDGVPNTRLRWQLIRNLNASVSDINEEIEKEDSASAAIFVDASADDVLLSADWACSVETLSEWDLNAFSVTLLELRDSAT